jgi:hypothetical protein
VALLAVLVQHPAELVDGPGDVEAMPDKDSRSHRTAIAQNREQQVLRPDALVRQRSSLSPGLLDHPGFAGCEIHRDLSRVGVPRWWSELRFQVTPDTATGSTTGV